MKTRLDLQNKLEELLGSKNVYYQPPENLKIEYPCIVYSKRKISHNNADNNKYLKSNSYDIIVMDKKPDNIVIDKILELPYSSFDRHYISNNFNHDVIILYF